MKALLHSVRALSAWAAAASVASVAALALPAAIPREAEAAIMITSAEARAFLGGRTGRIAYLRGAYNQVYFLDFSDSVLTERRVSEDYYCLSPMIHPDGSRVLYEHQQSIWIRDLAENVPPSARILIWQRPALRQNQTLEPRWWMDPKDSTWYVLWNTGTIEDHVWPPASGGTYMQKLGKDYKPVGPPTLLIPFMMSAGRSRDGKWGGTSHHSTGMYQLHPDKVENAFFGSTNWLPEGAVLACNASISPSKDPARMNRMMHLTSGGFTMHGAQYDNHKAVLIRSYTDPSPNEPLWWMGIPGDRCNNDSSGNLFWGAPEWSTDEEYFTATGSKEVLPALDMGDLYMARINLQGENRILRVLKGGNQDFYSHLWIKDGLRPARMRLDKPSLSFAAYAKDSADPAPQQVKVLNAGDGALPPLSIGSLPSWLKVSVQSTAKDTVILQASVQRAGLAPGEHRAKVPVTFGSGVDSVAFDVVFRFSDPVLTTLRPHAPRPVVLAGDTVRLAADGLDQTGKRMPGKVQVAWTGLDGIAPTADGLFQADTLPWRNWRAVGTSGSVSCTVTVVSARKLLRIDAGDAAAGPAPGWEPESSYVTGGTRGSLSDTVRLAWTPAAPPDAARRSYRQAASSWSFPALPNGRYHVRMHWLASRPGEESGASARFEGSLLLSDYNLPAPPDSQTRAADMKEIPVTVSDGNGLRIDMASWRGAAALSALEIYDVGVPPVSLTLPNGGETYAVGDTLTIRWDVDDGISSCGISVSVDSGAHWLPVTRLRSVGTSDPDWRAFKWAIPDTLDGKPMAGGKAMVMVYDYFGTDRDRSDRVFTITGPGVALRRGPATSVPGASALPGGLLRLDLGGLTGRYEAVLGDLRGRAAVSWTLAGGRSHRLAPGSLPPGLYRLTVRGPGLARTWLLPWSP